MRAIDVVPPGRKARRSIRRALGAGCERREPARRVDAQRGRGVDARRRSRAGRRTSTRGRPPRRPRGRARRRASTRGDAAAAEIFRQTASRAAPRARAAGVSSIAIAHRRRARATARSALDAVDRLLDELEPGGRERAHGRDRLLDVPRRRWRRRGAPCRGRRAARTAATPAGVVADPDLDLHAAEAGRAAAAAAAAAPARSSAPIVALTRDRVGGVVGDQLADRPCRARLPARSHSARSIAASACGRSRSALRAGVEQSPPSGPSAQHARRRRRAPRAPRSSETPS